MVSPSPGAGGPVRPGSGLRAALLPLAFELRRRYLVLRHRGLTAEPGVRIGGSIRLRGPVRVHLGAGTRLRRDVRFYGRGTITVGRDVLLNGSKIGAATSVVIGDRCLIGDAYLDDSDYHNLAPEDRHLPPGPRTRAPIVLEENVWVGSTAAICKGVTIGRDSVIGRDTVVRRSVPASVVVVGNPAQVVKRFGEERAEHRADDAGGAEPAG